MTNMTNLTSKNIKVKKQIDGATVGRVPGRLKPLPDVLDLVKLVPSALDTAGEVEVDLGAISSHISMGVVCLCRMR